MEDREDLNSGSTDRKGGSGGKEEEEARQDLGHISIRLSLRGCQKLNQSSVQSPSLLI